LHPRHNHSSGEYASVTVSLKANGVPPGDINADQMEALPDISEKYGYGELRVSHEQNLILANAVSIPVAVAIGRVIGPTFAREQMPQIIHVLIQTYLKHLDSEAERFINVVERLAIEPFKSEVYSDPTLVQSLKNKEVIDVR